MLLSTSDVQLRELCQTPLCFAIFPNDLRFARALYALQELAIHLDVDYIVNRWNFQAGEYATYQEHVITAHQVPEVRDHYG